VAKISALCPLGGLVSWLLTAQASGRRVALGARVGPPLCPGQAGAGLCFLPQNFLGGPPNPA
jgi:hypothetical protein